MTRDKTKTLLICVVLALVILAAYEGVRKNEFVNYDDDTYVRENSSVQKGLSFKSITWAFTSLYEGNWHPLTWLSHIIDYSIFGSKPAGHHLVSVGFHITNAILLFLVLKRMTGAFWPSAFVAAVFGLHPLGVDSVAWVAQRKNILSAFFALLTIAAYFLWTQKRDMRRYLLVVLLFAAGLLAKPMIVTLPFVLILLDYWPLNRINSKFSILNSIYEKLPLLFMSAVSCVVTYIAQAKSETITDFVSLPLSVRLCNALTSYVNYIVKIFYPRSLAVLYPFDINRPVLWMTVLCFLLLAAVSSAAIVLRRRKGFLFTGWFWYLGTLVPVIGLVQVGIQSMADRYAYWPDIGIYIIIAWLAGDLREKLKLPKPVLAMFCVFIAAVLLMMTRVQVRYWRNSMSLYEHTLAVTENNFFIHNSYGELLRKAGRSDEAMRHFNRSVEINPEFARAYGNLGVMLGDKGLYTEAAAEFERSLQINPDLAMVNNYYGIMLAERGLYDKAIEHFKKALKPDQHFSGVLRNLCNAGLKAGKTGEVLEVIETWQKKMPDNADLRYWKAQLEQYK